jgi:hypothetical protein
MYGPRLTDEADRIAELIRLAPIERLPRPMDRRSEGNTTEVKAVNITSEIDTYDDTKTAATSPVFATPKSTQIHYERPVN